MIYSFIVLNGVDLPIFSNKLGSENMDFNVCLDTGCGLTTFYMDKAIVKFLYPDIKKSNTSVKMRSADGIERNNDVYIIPEFELMDKDGEKLLIKNLYCNISKTRLNNINVLLSGNVFYNASLTITPNTDDNGARRLIRVDTFKDERNTLVMKPVKNLDGVIVAYPTYFKSIK